MRKIIHSKFELDLSNFSISDTETNNQFSDAFFTQVTFPFEIDLVKDLDIAFGFISLFNSLEPVTYFDVKYVHDDTVEDAVFEVNQLQQKVSCTLTFGFDQLPSWDKKLSELSLEKFDLPVGTSIYDFANTIVPQTWPAVNYNFPQVHTDRYDQGSEEWFYFDRIINNRVNGVFLTNYFDLVDEESRNYNIIQPLPYWIYILQRGMIDAGYVLSGDILNDVKLQKACLFSSLDYFYNNTLKEYYFEDVLPMIQGELNGTLPTDSSNFIVYNVYSSTYYKSYTIDGIGKYQIRTKIDSNSLVGINAYLRIKVNGIQVYEYLVPPTGFFYTVSQFLFPIIETTLKSNLLEVELLIGDLNEPGPINGLFMEITPFYLYDGSTTPIISIINENKIDLTAAVPDITFGDFIKVVKNWFNYDLTIVGKLAIMNKVENLMNYDNAIDLSEFEVLYPLRKFHQGYSYLLKFQDVVSDVYKFLPVFQNLNGYVTSGYVTDTKTETIEIPALPLPTLVRNGSTTAYALEDDDAKVYLVKYDGLTNGINTAVTNAEYLVPAIHLTNWLKWFRFRINSQSFTMSFKSWAEKIKDLTSKSKLYAYGQIHIVKTINKTEVKPGLFQVDIETETLK